MGRHQADYYQSIPTTVSAKRKALKVIHNHTFKADQDCKAFNLRLDRKLGRPDASTFVAGAHAQARSFPSVAKNTITKYLSGPSIGKPKRGPCLGCELLLHLAMDCPCQNEPEVRAQIDKAVESIRAARKARSNKGERRRKNTPNFSDFSRGHQKKVRTQVLAAMAAEEEEPAYDDRSGVPHHDDRGSRYSCWGSPPSSGTRPDDDHDRRPYYTYGEYDRDSSHPDRSNNTGRAYHGRGRSEQRQSIRFANDDRGESSYRRCSDRGHDGNDRDRNGGGSRGAGRSGMGPVVFVSMSRIFQVSGGVKVPLQVQIHLKMPQIVMLFVQDFVDQFLVQVAVLVDSCAALNTMYLPFSIYLCKK